MTTRMTDRFGRRLPPLPKFIHPADIRARSTIRDEQLSPNGNVMEANHAA